MGCLGVIVKGPVPFSLILIFLLWDVGLFGYCFAGPSLFFAPFLFGWVIGCWVAKGCWACYLILIFVLLLLRVDGPAVL